MQEALTTKIKSFDPNFTRTAQTLKQPLVRLRHSGVKHRPPEISQVPCPSLIMILVLRFWTLQPMCYFAYLCWWASLARDYLPTYHVIFCFKWTSVLSRRHYNHQISKATQRRYRRTRARGSSNFKLPGNGSRKYKRQRNRGWEKALVKFKL